MDCKSRAEEFLSSCATSRLKCPPLECDRGNKRPVRKLACGPSAFFALFWRPAPPSTAGPAGLRNVHIRTSTMANDKAGLTIRRKIGLSWSVLLASELCS